MRHFDYVTIVAYLYSIWNQIDSLDYDSFNSVSFKLVIVLIR